MLLKNFGFEVTDKLLLVLHNNALSRAILISTEKLNIALGEGGNVSMPLLGRFPFLHITKAAAEKRSIMFQCPFSGDSHFYAGNERSLEREERCFNALSRAIPISTYRENRKKWDERKFQCPFSGDSHFYSMPCKGS